VQLFGCANVFLDCEESIAAELKRGSTKKEEQTSKIAVLSD
jgi:hypothetical protein